MICRRVAVPWQPMSRAMCGPCLVEVGSKVKAGDTLVVIESMKMEIAVLAPCDGEIIQLNCRTGGQVSAGQDLLVIHSDE